MVFTNQDLELYCVTHNIAGKGRDYLLEAADRPSRLASAQGHKSVAVEFSSPKMGCSIVAESRTGEYSYALIQEYDPAVVAYFEQPPAVECLRRDRNGKQGPRLYTPDFLVLHENGARIVEIKSAKEIENRLTLYPDDWIRGDDGNIQDLPAIDACARLGFPHHVVSTDTLPQIYIANIRLLMQARIEGAEPPPQIERRAIAGLSAQASMTIAGLADLLAIKDLTPILRLIDKGVIFADLKNCLLPLAESTLVSTCPELLDLPDTVEHEGQRVPITTVLTKRQAERALEIVNSLDSGAKGRSYYRHRKLIAEGARSGLSPLQSVLPKFHLRGNRSPKRPAAVLDALDQFLKTYWASPNRPTVSAAFRLYKAFAREQDPDLAPVSSATFRRKLECSQQVLAFGRGGIRAANAAASPTDVMSRAVPAMRPFEVASCDHYLCDVHLQVLKGERIYTAQPWLTVLVDVATSIVLGVSLAFMSPSKTSCALALRAVVRRHARLPEAIVVDRGSEFRSVYFSALLAHCGVSQIVRPRSHPRYGAEAERFFGIYKSEWLSLRPGNSASKVESRSVSSGHKSSEHAELDLGGLLSEFEQYLDWRSNNVRNACDMSPFVQFAQLIQRFPFSGIAVEDNEAFRVASCIDESCVSFDPCRGLQMSDPRLWYWSPQLAKLKPRVRVEVRRDPENIHVIFARVHNEWVPCYSSRHLIAIHEDPIRVRHQSLSLYTARDLRKEAKKDADARLIQKIREADDQRTRLSNTTDSNDESEHPDPFDTVRGSMIDPLPSKPWTDS